MNQEAEDLRVFKFGGSSLGSPEGSGAGGAVTTVGVLADVLPVAQTLRSR